MNDKVKNMIKSVVEENAVGFKQATSNALYEKIGSRLQEQYKIVSKDMLKKKMTVNEQVAPTPPTQQPAAPAPDVYHPVSPSPSNPNHPGFSPQPTAPWTRPPKVGDQVKDKNGNPWIYTQNPDGSYEWRRIPPNQRPGTPGRINPQSPNRRPGRGYGPG